MASQDVASSATVHARGSSPVNGTANATIAAATGATATAVLRPVQPHLLAQLALRPARTRVGSHLSSWRLMSAGPSAVARDTVVASARAHRLRVLSANRWTVTVDGSAGDVAAWQRDSDVSTLAHVVAGGGGRIAEPRFTPAPLGPSDLRRLYDIPTPTAGGAPVTVATLQFSGWDSSDLSGYAAALGLPDPVASGQFSAVSVDGADPSEPDGTGGDVEVALDQSALLAAAPLARQVAYVTDNSLAGDLDALYAIADQAAAQHVVALSISWGMCEQAQAASLGYVHDALTAVLAAGVTVFAASGDDGSADCQGTSGSATDAVDYPASDPLVVGVGGTSVDPVTSEQRAWGYFDDPSQEDYGHGSGGGTSLAFGRPSWQAKLGWPGSQRLVPDIAGPGDAASGLTFIHRGSRVVAGGTSLAAPAMAGGFAAALSSEGFDLGVGDIHAELYAAPPSAYADIIQGSNGSWSARAGYDPVAGLGTPRWSSLVQSIVGGPRLTAPAYSRSLTVPVRVTAPIGMVLTQWQAAAGAVPDSLSLPDTTAPTSITAPRGGRVALWVAAARPQLPYALTAGTTIFVDLINPTAVAHSRRSGTRTITVYWTGSDSAPASGVARYSIVVRRVGSSSPVWKASATRPGYRKLTISLHQRYIVTVVATDRSGRVSRASSASVAT